MIVLLLFSIELSAQDDYYDYEAELEAMEEKPRIGLFGNFILNYHVTDFRALPGVESCCPKYTDGFGSGFLLGGLYEMKLADNMFGGLRAGYSMFDAELRRIESINLIIDGKSFDGEFEHAVNADFSRIQIFPYISLRLKNHLFAHAGIDFALLTGGDYRQIEVIKKPTDRGTFSNGLRYRNNNEGEIQDLNIINMALRVGLSYELPFTSNKSLRFAPEMFYSYWILNNVAERKWNMHQLDLGLSVKYIAPPPPPPPPVPPMSGPMPDIPLPSDPPAITAKVSAVELDSLGRESSNFSIKLEDFTSLSMRPLLNFIFFDYNSSELPSRYKLLSKEGVLKFSMRQLQSADALETYYNVLNIIGLRMTENPQVSITVVGNNSNKDAEKNNKALSLARANSVKNYLTSSWGIDEKRIAIVARNLPKEATNSDDDVKGSDEENQRVEIISNSNVISEPVITGDTIRILSDTKVRFFPQGETETGVKKWKLDIKHNNSLIRQFVGDGELPNNIDWEISHADTSAPHKSGSLTYSLAVTDNLNQNFETKPQRIPIEQLTVDRKRLERREDKEFEYYRLILFDYASSSLRDEHKKVVDFIKNRITPRSTVIISGYTDVIGKEEVNLRIATQRANSVARRLSIPGAIVKGIGESQLLYDQKLPESRFYCRTVTITIETQVTE